MTVPTIETLTPPLRVDETGTIRIGQSKITLDLVIGYHLLGRSPEWIARGYPSLTLADIYATIAYYLRHRDQLDAYLRAGEERAEALRKEIEADPRNKELRAKILARARERGLL